MKIAIFGARGIPAKWGGFDTFVSELAPRLVEMGHEVTVFCQPQYTDKEHKKEFNGVKIIILPTVQGKFTETVIHEFLSSVYSLFLRKYDIYYVLGCRSTWVYLIHWLLGRRLVINTDGLDWKRKKWGKIARSYLTFTYWLARKITNHLVSDSNELKKYYLQEYGKSSAFLTNGGNIIYECDSNILNEFGLEPHNYYLVACRIEPENNIDFIVNEYAKTTLKAKLVIAGGANYKSAHLQKLREAKDPRIIFLGPVYGDGHIEALHLHCKSYIHGHEVGGTNPSLLKALGCGNVVLCHSVSFNREVLSDTGLYWELEENSLKDLLERIDQNMIEHKRTAGIRCRDRIKDYYTWDKVAADHELYFRWVLGLAESYDDSF